MSQSVSHSWSLGLRGGALLGHRCLRLRAFLGSGGVAHTQHSASQRGAPRGSPTLLFVLSLVLNCLWVF